MVKNNVCLQDTLYGTGEHVIQPNVYMCINKVGRIIQAISGWNLMGFSFVNTLMKS